MNKHYFELDKVDCVTLTMERESNYKWYDATPSKPRRFMGIQFGMSPAKEAGWSEFSHDYNHRYASSYFDGYDWYRVDEINQKVLYKATVEVSFGYKQTISARFNSNEEAQAWVDELLASSDKKFHLIINH